MSTGVEAFKPHMYDTSILLIATDTEAIDSFRHAVEGADIRLEVASTVGDIDNKLAGRRFDALFVQTEPGSTPFESALANAVVSDRELPVVAVSRNGTIRDAVKAMRAGACDYLKAPLDGPDALCRALKSAREARPSKNGRGHAQAAMEGFLASDRDMLAACDTVLRIAPLAVPALITGESGVGKSFLARKLHELSPRREAPFVKVVCGPLSLLDLERDIFGDGLQNGVGRPQFVPSPHTIAGGGTLLLHQVSAEAVEILPDLLLAAGDGRNAGGFRIVLTSLQPASRPVCQRVLSECARYGQTAVVVQTPPLRERVADIPLLAKHFVRVFSRKHGRKTAEISPEAMACLVRHDWPGNVRELEAAIEHGVMLSRLPVIHWEDLPEPLLALHPKKGQGKPKNQPLKVALQESERDYIIRALDIAGWNKRHVAKTLRISRSTLYAKMRQHGLDAEDPVWGGASQDGNGRRP